MALNTKIGFIGAGNMAGAIIDAILASDILPANALFLFDTSDEKKEYYRKRGLTPVSSNAELAEICDIIFFAVKPQVIDLVLNDVKGKTNGKCIVSIAAGVSISRIKDVLGDDTQIIRVLPNTPMLVLKGATVIANPDGVDKSYIELITDIFKAAGAVEFLDEELINNVIPVSSSSPAFFFRMIRAMAQAGEKNGIAYNTALNLALETMHGAAHIMRESGKTPDELIAQVSSPGGTTIAALSAFDDMGYEALMDEAFIRCINRAEELGKKQ